MHRCSSTEGSGDVWLRTLTATKKYGMNFFFTLKHLPSCRAAHPFGFSRSATALGGCRAPRPLLLLLLLLPVLQLCPCSCTAAALHCCCCSAAR